MPVRPFLWGRSVRVVWRLWVLLLLVSRVWGVSPFPPLWWTICWFFSGIGPGSALCGSRLSGNVQLVDRRPTQAGRPSVRRYDFSQCERGCIYIYVCIIIIIIIITIIIIIIMNYREGGVSSGFCCPTFLCFFWVGLLLFCPLFCFAVLLARVSFQRRGRGFKSGMSGSSL